MRHGNAFRNLSRTSSHRRALLRNLATSLVIEGRITTTLPKAKELRKVADKLVTIAKRASKETELHARRQAMTYLAPVNREQDGNAQKLSAVHKLFTELAPGYAKREGGYTRVVRLSALRDGDRAPMALIEFVEAGAPEKKKKGGRRRRKPANEGDAATAEQ